MGTIEGHTRRIQEHIGEIRDAIDEGIENKPITIGFHCSACAVELLELSLHISKKLPIGKIIKHTWFARPKEGQKVDALAERKIGVQFPHKEKIYDLLYTIEEYRDSLIYGNPDPKLIHVVYNSFKDVQNILQETLGEEGFDLEKE